MNTTWKVRFIKIFAIALLIFNGIGASYGGISLITHPDGSSIGLPLSLLDGTMFENYFIPGIILITVNGCFNFLVAAFTLLQTRHYREYILAAGIMLIGWLAVQIVLIKMLFFLHYVMGAVGILLIVSGFALKRGSYAAKEG